jgi:hypothetical protein
MAPTTRRQSTAATLGNSSSAAATKGRTSDTKKRKLEAESPLKAMDDENEDCLICYENFTQTGEHRVVCLKCGHLFGKKCIEQWIKEKKKCPTCNVVSQLIDIRVIYGNFSDGDRSQSNELREQIKKLQTEMKAWQKERMDFVGTTERLQGEKTIWQSERLEFVSTIERLEAELSDKKKTIEDLHSLYSVQPDDKTFALIIKPTSKVNNIFKSKITTGRPLGFDLDGNFVVTSFDSLVNGGKNGIQKMPFGEGSVEKLQAHKGTVRCIRVCPFNSNLIASISDVDKELNIYESKQDRPLELRHSLKLEHSAKTFCWETESKIVFGAQNGTLQRIKIATKITDELVEKNNEPILNVFYNRDHEVFFVGTSKGVYAYREDITELVEDDPNDSKSRIQSFYYDSASNCFLVTILPGDGSPIKLQLFKVKITGSQIVATKIREYVTNIKTTTSTTSNIFWVAPTGHIVCSFYEERNKYTRIFNWGKLNELLGVKAQNERKLQLGKDAVSHYAHFTRKTQPGPLAPNGVQDVFVVLTSSDLNTYAMLYEKSED